ncbi:ABC transporter permease [Aquibacillus koreensis]|uniref:ABC transporter permease n=1 Tax=Aquibacillus koreensis TaxID=279446 RepID=A0A9X3WLI2_9BACI|nr:ABC transporter permease [Aquibacillus koreensis]MCT2536071.1 ABC transporter permease [Aquibacillus koreensis]MDC3419494.1 ABC transporter permease [Aquibacillus koreensis]
MFAYTIRRLLQLIPVLFGMTLLVFFIVHAIPGNPAQVMLGQHATEESVQKLTNELGLNEPWYIQYINYLQNLVTGDLGDSIRTGAPIVEELWPYLAATMELSVVAMIFAVFIGVNAGIISAWFQNKWIDYVAMFVALIGISVPIFWLGLMQQWLFAVELGWFAPTGREDARAPIDPITHFFLIDTLIQGDWDGFVETVRRLVLPATALGTFSGAFIARMTRSSMLEVMRSDYIRTARSKGMKMIKVVYKHALKNSIIPVLTVVGLQMGLLLGGAVLTETIFGWPGIGRYIYDAIQFRDYPVVQSGILIVALFFVLINLCVDLLYSVVDPRIKYK